MTKHTDIPADLDNALRISFPTDDVWDSAIRQKLARDLMGPRPVIGMSLVGLRAADSTVCVGRAGTGMTREVLKPLMAELRTKQARDEANTELWALLGQPRVGMSLSHVVRVARKVK